jgi:hypothetical protein
MAHKKIALQVSLDKEGGFNRTSFVVITVAAQWHWVGSTIIIWINTMPGSGSIKATLFGENLEVSKTTGCLQGWRAFVLVVKPGRR